MFRNQKFLIIKPVKLRILILFSSGNTAFYTISVTGVTVKTFNMKVAPLSQPMHLSYHFSEAEVKVHY